MRRFLKVYIYLNSTWCCTVMHTALLQNKFKATDRSSCRGWKPTFHESRSLGDVVQQLVEDGSDGLLRQHEVLQRGHRGFCHGVPAGKVTSK